MERVRPYSTALTGLLRTKDPSFVRSRGVSPVTSQLRRRREIGAECSIPAKTLAYAYDATGRPTKTDFSLAATADIGIVYDSLGNATKISGPATELQYAHEGARMTKETYAWDARDKLTKVRKQPDGGSMADVAAYSYDSQGRRFQKIAGGVTKTYYQDGLTPVVEKTSAGAIYNQSVPGALGNVIDSTMTYYAYDRLGNVLATFSTAGAIFSAPVMDAFGNVLQGDQAGFHLTTKQYDTDVELYYFNARWYDPATGLHVRRSPYNAVMEHAYAYSFGNPVNLADPRGEIPLPRGYKDAIAGCIATGLAALAAMKCGVLPTDASDQICGSIGSCVAGALGKPVLGPLVGFLVYLACREMFPDSPNLNWDVGNSFEECLDNCKSAAGNDPITCANDCARIWPNDWDGDGIPD